jgi:hypothetical protein
MLEAIITRSDEIVDAPEKATHDRIFVLKSGDVFPYEIIRSLHKINISFAVPVIYNGSLVGQEVRFFIKNSQNIGEIKVPIYNLRPLGYCK